MAVYTCKASSISLKFASSAFLITFCGGSITVIMDNKFNKLKKILKEYDKKL